MSNAAVQNKPNALFAAVYCIGAPVLFLLVLVIPASRAIFEQLIASHPFISGFVKFAMLSTSGEMLVGIMIRHEFSFPYAFAGRAIVWGLLGIVMTLVFKLFGAGVASLLQIGYLPGGSHFFLKALWTSVCMNLFFAPVMMGAHRLFDSWLDLKEEKEPCTLAATVKKMDWSRYVTFVLVKTIPLFWIPAHTITFLLPDSYRVVLAAFLSIALGAIMAIASEPKQ